MTSHKQLIPPVCLVGILVLGMLLVGFGADVRMTGEAAVISTELPDRVGAWEGTLVLHCHGRECQRMFRGEECEGLKVCPDCGAEVGTMAYAEYAMLPKDTTLNRKQYRHPSGTMLQAAIVLSGQQRASLHRPELCLTGPTVDITRTHIITVDLADGTSLDVKVLDLVTSVAMPDGKVGQYGTYYAYWFAGRDRLTPSHYTRMLWMAFDKVVHSRIDRWAYISVAGRRDGSTLDHLEEARSFIREYYPLVRVR